MTSPAATQAVRYLRKVIHISAEDSPNVRRGLAQQQAGVEATGLLANGEPPLPGVLTWEEYTKRLRTWDEVHICVGIHGQFWEGKEALLFPPDWLNSAERVWRKLRGKVGQAKGVGIDPGEGEANTASAAVAEAGLVELESFRTPDTNVITGNAINFMTRHGVQADRCCFDRGGGGKQAADRMRAKGYEVRTVAFGAKVSPEMRRGMTPYRTRRDAVEGRFAYVNMRAQLYGTLSMLLDPSLNEDGWAIPPPSAGPQYAELRRQLALIPRLTDEEGRLWLPPKQRKDRNKKKRTLTEILGRFSRRG
jgi:hypothetical protein